MLADRRLNTAQLPSDREVQIFIATHPEMFDNRETWKLDQVQYLHPEGSRHCRGDPKDQNAWISSWRCCRTIRSISSGRRTASTPRSCRRSSTRSSIALPSGEPFVVPVGDRSVASAWCGREPKPLAGDQAKPIAVARCASANRKVPSEGLMKSLRSSAKIEYQPGYGPPKKELRRRRVERRRLVAGALFLPCLCPRP